MVMRKNYGLPRWTRALMITAGLVGLLASGQAARAATPDEVNAAIEKGVKFLYDTQQNGNWEVAQQRNAAGEGHSVTGGQWGGLTAMATYALLAAGESPQDERIMKALDFLLTRESDIVGTYAVSLRAQVWLFIPAKHPYRSRIVKATRRDRDHLLMSFYGAEQLFNKGGNKGGGGNGNADRPTNNAQGNAPPPPAGVQRGAGGNNADKNAPAMQGGTPPDLKTGFYSYEYDGYSKGPKPAGHYDRSNSQYGVLGVWAVEQAGAEVPRKYWELQDKVWKAAQNDDGGWEYTGEAPTTATMAAAGLATLFITLDALSDQTGQCRGNQFNQHIEKAMGWMDKNVGAVLAGQNYYLLYGVERIGVASGRKYFGGQSWYEVGSELIVRSQAGNGAWGGDDAVHSPKAIPNTCFALYFLTRGRAPVVMNKLEWKSVAKEGKASGWNQRQRDLNNFSRWMSKNLDNKYINWQIVDLHPKKGVDDLHDSAILYMAGSEPFVFTDEEVKLIQRFVEDGGLVYGNADCGKAPFAKAFKAMAKKVFPAYEFRELEPTHPIFAAQQFKADKWKRRPKVLGLSNGVRELMILVPDADPPKAWQSRSFDSRAEAFQFGANLALYANGGRTLTYRGITHIVKDAGKTPAAAVKVARIQAGDNPNPEPGGWRRLNIVMKNDDLATLSGYEQLIKAGEGKLKAGGYKVAHLTGTTKFKLDDKASAELKEFVAGGGTLVLDAAGGASDFADAAEAEVAAMFGAAAKKQLAKELPATHAFYQQGEKGTIKSFGYRDYAREKVVGRLKTPRLKGVEVGKRLGVFVSREDLTGGLVGSPVDGIIGYDPATATAIMRNIVMHAAGIDGGAAAPVAITPPAAPAADAGGGDAAQ